MAVTCFPPTTFTTHSQITLRAPVAVNTSWTCRHALMKVAGAVCWYPQPYQLAFISWPKARMTGEPNRRTARA